MTARKQGLAIQHNIGTSLPLPDHFLKLLRAQIDHKHPDIFALFGLDHTGNGRRMVIFGQADRQTRPHAAASLCTHSLIPGLDLRVRIHNHKVRIAAQRMILQENTDSGDHRVVVTLIFLKSGIASVVIDHLLIIRILFYRNLLELVIEIKVRRDRGHRILQFQDLSSDRLQFRNLRILRLTHQHLIGSVNQIADNGGKRQKPAYHID